MNIPIEEIIAFHTRRTQCHIETLNYFAQLLGCHFPEHDKDKNTEPYRTGYAYYNYAKHHQNCAMLPQQHDAFSAAHDEHHKMQPHHIEHYYTMADIPDIIITEMICDWHSANFEQNVITHENEFATVTEFFCKKMSKHDWSARQLGFIRDTIDEIAQRADYDEVIKIWSDLAD